MRRLFVLAALLFAIPAHAVTIDWVTVGDPGNACDTQPQGCFGAVDYVYRIGKYEVTNAQYAEFLNAVADTDTYGLYNTTMGYVYGGITRSGSSGSYTYSAIAGREDMPVNYVSFWDALRFSNWLHNGQPTGAQDNNTTEDGAYTITADGIANNSITRNAGATIFLTSEDEWYKAAYYDASTMSYNPYPFADGFDGVACQFPPGSTSHSANCGWSTPAVGDLTDVGAYTGSANEYGSFDQGGNVFEWNEAIYSGTHRVLRGGGFDSMTFFVAASYQFNYFPWGEHDYFGFRVAMIPGPDVDIKANGSDGPVTIADGNNVRLDISISAGIYAGVPVEIWVVVNTPFGFYSWGGGGWVYGLQPAYTGGLLDYSGNVLNLLLPLGSYIGYLALDGHPNRVPDSLPYLDTVEFEVAP